MRLFSLTGTKSHHKVKSLFPLGPRRSWRGREVWGLVLPGGSTGKRRGQEWAEPRFLFAVVCGTGDGGSLGCYHSHVLLEVKHNGGKIASNKLFIL